MKNYKGNMLLIELVIVILFFSLSQVVLVQVFARAQSVAADSEKLNYAMRTMQDIAEQLSSTEEPDKLFIKLGFSGEDGQYVYASEQGVDLYAHIRRLSQTGGQLLIVELSAKQGGEELFILPSVRYFPAEVLHEQ